MDTSFEGRQTDENWQSTANIGEWPLCAKLSPLAWKRESSVASILEVSLLPSEALDHHVVKGELVGTQENDR